MKDTIEPLEGIFASRSHPNRISSATAGSAAQNRPPVSTPRNEFCENDIPMSSLSVTLDPVSISGDVALQPYWNPRCAENQCDWWLPHRTGSRGRDTPSSDISSNYLEVRSSFWKKTISPGNLTSERSLRISLPSATPSTTSVQVKGTRRIRVYPRDPGRMVEYIRQQRRAYNLAVACFRETDQRPDLRRAPELGKTELRRTIRDFVRSEVSERNGVFYSAGGDEAVNAAFRTRDAVIRKRVEGKACDCSFRSLRDIRQRFHVQKLTPGFMEGNFDLTEPIPEEAWKKLTTIVLERGQWFICAQKYITTVGQDEIQASSIVAIDPGVRTFATAYTMNHAAKYGDGFFSTKVFPLLLRLDDAIGLRAKAKHVDWKRHFQKKIDRLSTRIRNLIDDLHRRVAYDLVSNFDIILLPSFETREMSARTDRKISTKTVRSMLGLAHYRFEQHLAWMARKYGKRLIICNEAYTSKTVSWTGRIKQALGGATTISDNGLTVDRDINGARGVILRALYGDLCQFQAVNADVAFLAE